MDDTPPAIPALRHRGTGHQFVLYGDACSGVPGAVHERTFAAVNAVLRRLSPPPDFIVFTGDEIAGLTADTATLRAQWRHWLDHEMAWCQVPMWHATGNHTTYDPISEAIFAAMLPHLPRNGPPGQAGLSYYVRRGDLLLVFVHTLWSGLGGEGHVETDWLRATLAAHADARHRIVVGHHPVHPVNGFAGAYQRDIGPEHAGAFWDVLVAHGVLAYVCSHILAFDVQVHRGVLQICTAGAGTAHRMPDGIEYLHLVQAALDADGLRYQVLDEHGAVRETLSWPLPDDGPLPAGARLFRFAGHSAAAGTSAAQTLLTAFDPGVQAPLWIGLRGPRQTLTVIFGPEPGRSPHYWSGGAVPADTRFAFELLVHPGMGPGGFLYRPPGGPWSSLSAASPWGPERLRWPRLIVTGHGQHGPADRPFLGRELVVIDSAEEG